MSCHKMFRFFCYFLNILIEFFFLNFSFLNDVE